MPVIVRGDREVAQVFDTFPQQARQKLAEAIRALTTQLDVAVEAAAPVRTGRLRSEIRGRVYDDQAQRVAGYVSVYAPGAPTEYPKAATLEYGSRKARRRFQKRESVGGAIYGKKKRVVLGMSKPVNIGARRYLRGPLAAMQGEIRATLEAALAEAVAESGGGP